MSENRFRTCFIAASPRVNTAPLRAELEARGVRWVDAASATPVGSSFLDTLNAAIEEADFVCAVIPDDAKNASVLFELGLAIGRGKPVLVFIDPNVRPPFDLHEAPYVRATLSDAEALRFHLDAFLKHAGSAENQIDSSDGDARTAQQDAATFRRVLEQVSAWESAGSSPDEGELVELLARLFEAAGAVASTAHNPAGAETERADLAVWIDALQASVGNPLLIEVVGPREAAPEKADQLRRYLMAWNSSLGLVVQWENGRNPEQRKTPRWPLVLSMDVKELVNSVTGGTFVQDLLERRNRAVHGPSLVAR